jgi:hypothetical protein
MNRQYFNWLRFCRTADANNDATNDVTNDATNDSDLFFEMDTLDCDRCRVEILLPKCENDFREAINAKLFKFVF